MLALVAAFTVAVLPAESPDVPRTNPPAADTVFLTMGAPEVDARVYAPHRAKVTVRLGAPDGPVVAEWINELTHGDSAGRAVHRWVTTGTQMPVNGPRSTWEIRQTYDARTLQPYAYHRFGSDGIEVQLRLDGTQVTGRRKVNTPDFVPVAVELDQPGYVASASDLVPMAMKLAPGMVIVAPMWGPNMQRTERRVFTVVGREHKSVEGHHWNAWRIEERRFGDPTLLAVWFMVDESPYMVAGEVHQPNGIVRYMTEVAVPE